MSVRSVIVTPAYRGITVAHQPRSVSVAASFRQAASAFSVRSVEVEWAVPVPQQQQVTQPGVVEDGLFETGPVP